VALDLFHRARVDHRPDLRILARGRADSQCSDAFRELPREAVVNSLLYIHPIRAHACLAAIAKFRPHQSFDCRIDVRILEDDEWRIATELERKLLQRCSGTASQLFADSGRARECDFSHAGVRKPCTHGLRRMSSRSCHAMARGLGGAVRAAAVYLPPLSL
jgi:hypothetical protein